MKFYNYNNVHINIQEQIIDLFKKEWGIEYTKELMNEKWCEKHPDNILLVLCDDLNSLIGTVGLNHDFFIPVVSHLYVLNEHRKRGYGKILMNEIIKHSDKKMHGWCLPEKVEYYEELGWKKDNWFGFAKYYTKVIGFFNKNISLVPMSRYGIKFKQ
jgi:GNAT superfamily N-acetyltransferase